MLRLREPHYLAIVGHALDDPRHEVCGLLVGPVGSGNVTAVHRCRNAHASARTYEVDPHDVLRVTRAAEQDGHDLIGVYHSHTHTEAWPSPRDIELAVDPDWHYVIVSLKDAEPVLRSFRIVEGEASEEMIVLDGR
jgi:proteasome lid subunit RPN8/RPN11